MSIILKHVLRNIKKNKIRSLLIILALTVATTVLILNITMPNEIVLKLEKTLRGVYGKTDLAVSTMEPFGIDDLNLNDEKIEYSGMTQTEVINNENDEPIAIFGIDIEQASKFEYIDTDIKGLVENEVAITEKTAEKYNHKIGDTIKVTHKDKEYELKVVKIIKEKGFASLKMDDELLFANIKTVNKIENIPDNKFNTIYIDVENDEKIGEVKDFIKDNNKNYIVERLVDEESIREQCTQITSLISIIVVMATIMIFFVVSSLNKIVLAERFPIIGTFRSVGATRGKMNKILLLENAIYGLVGGILGSILGNALNSKAATLFVMSDSINISEETTALSPSTIIIGILFAVLLQIFITAKEIIRTNKKPIKDLIFNSQNSRYKIRKARTVVGGVLIVLSAAIDLINIKSNMALTLVSLVLFFIGISYIIPLIIIMIAKGLSVIFKKLGRPIEMMACKNIANNKMIISSSRLVVIALSLMLCIITVSASITDLFNMFRKSTEGVDIIIQNIKFSADNYEKLKDIDNVDSINYLYFWVDEETTYNDGKKFKAFAPTFVGVGTDANGSGVKGINYNMLDLKNYDVLIDEKYAEKNEIKTGDILKIKFGTKNIEKEYKVVGLADSAMFTTSRNVIVISEDTLKKDFTEVPMQVHLTCAKGTDLEKMKDEVKDSIKEVGVKIQTTEEYIKMQEEQTQGVMSMFYVILGLAMFLSFIGILNNQIIGFIQRNKELAVLNSTCMSKRQLRKMILAETIIANVIACVFAVIISILSTGTIGDTMLGMDMYIDIVVDFKALIKFALIMFAVLLITVLIPYRRLRKMNVVNEIKYE